MSGLLRSTRLTLLLLFAALGLSGCGLQFFTPPKENPVISDNVSDNEGGARIYRVLSNTPERRMVVFNVDQKNKSKRFGTFCSEAPADAAESISSTFQAALEASLTKKKGSAEAAKTLATAVQALAPRSQGVMLFRDAGYRYCEAYMNGLINGDQLVGKIDKLLDVSSTLIETELKKNNGKIGYAPPALLSAPQQVTVFSLRKPGKNNGTGAKPGRKK